MKRGYVVGEYILVSFFFLILFVLIVNTFTDFTLNEYEKVNEFEECKNSKKLFEKLFDDELVLTNNSNYANILSNYTSENNISILSSNITQLGFSNGQNKLNYTVLKQTFDKLKIYDWNNYENSTDSFSISMGAIGAKVDSIYASESLATSSCNPTANIWLNDSTSNPNTVHKTIGISVCDNNYNSKLKFKIKIPNATELNFNTTTGLTITNNSDHLLLEGDINPTVSETRKTFYITYSSETATYSDWGSKFTTFGEDYDSIANIDQQNNLIIFEELRFYDVNTDKNYDIIFGSNTLANLEWGPEYSEGCNYNRIYTVVDEYTRKNMTINGNIFEYNTSPQYYSWIEVTSR